MITQAFLLLVVARYLLGDRSATNTSSDNRQSMNSRKGKSRRKWKACLQRKAKLQEIWMTPASASKALKRQLDEGPVPGHLFGFAEQPQDAPSCVQRWCVDICSPHAAFCSVNGTDHHYQTGNKHGSIMSNAELQKLPNDAAIHQKQCSTCIIKQAELS